MDKSASTSTSTSASGSVKKPTAFEVLKSAGLKKKQMKPYRGFEQLSVGHHEIQSYRLVTTQYGVTLLIELNGEVLFLPKYFAKDMTEEMVNELNNDDEKKYLYFGGKNKS